MGRFYREKEGLCFKGEGEKLCIVPWGTDSLRVRSAYMREIEDTAYSLLAQEKTACEIVIDEKQASITNGKIKAVIRSVEGGNPAEISFYNSRGELLLKEAPRGGALVCKAREYKPIIGGDYSLRARFEASPDEKLYGMGQYQEEFLNIKYCSFELAHKNSQASIPFVLSSKGYGMLWHNPAIGRVEFAKNMTTWYADSTKQLDYWLTAGDTPAQIEEAYARATGTVPMMPEYGLGFWQCKLRYWNQEQLLEVAREYKRRNLPIDVIVCDFFHWPKMGDFRFEEEFFPNPKAMVEELKSLGIELMVSVWPQIDVESENYQEMQEENLLVRPEKGMNICMGFGGYSNFYDATNPQARSYVWEKCRKNYYDYGIRIFWLDEAEPEYGVYDYDNYRYAMGTNAQIGNIYPQLYSRTFYEGMQKEGQENIVNLVRCAWSGSQRYGALVWSGDIHSNFETLRKQVVAGLQMGIAGIPWWTTDIGGFAGGNPSDESFRELLVRWFQWGTFCPVMRLHGDRQPGTPLYYPDGRSYLFTGADNEVWSFGEENYAILKKYMEYREQMRPYIRRLMQEAHEKGTPVMRTMFYEFPEDEKCWELKDQYMFGDKLLVAPIMEAGAVARTVYLPKGAVWQEVQKGITYEGGITLEVKAPIEEIPLFIKC